MCTVTWLQDRAGFHLLHNRDELRTRKPALGPQIQVRDGVRFIAPVDADAGGTWIGVNEFGLAACLLNRYDPPAKSQILSFTSRGVLLMNLLTAESVNVAQSRVIDDSLEHYQPFELVLAQRAPSCVASSVVAKAQWQITVLDWTGRTLRIDTQPDLRLPLVSSSMDGIKADEVRRRLFAPLRGHASLEALRQFHASHASPANEPTPQARSQGSAFSVCMHRADAQTVSFTEIELTADQVALRYQATPPCEAASVETWTLTVCGK